MLTYSFNSQHPRVKNLPKEVPSGRIDPRPKTTKAKTAKTAKKTKTKTTTTTTTKKQKTKQQ